MWYPVPIQTIRSEAFFFFFFFFSKKKMHLNSIKTELTADHLAVKILSLTSPLVPMCSDTELDNTVLP